MRYRVMRNRVPLHKAVATPEHTRPEGLARDAEIAYRLRGRQ